MQLIKREELQELAKKNNCIVIPWGDGRLLYIEEKEARELFVGLETYISTWDIKNEDHK